MTWLRFYLSDLAATLDAMSPSEQTTALRAGIWTGWLVWLTVIVCRPFVHVSSENFAKSEILVPVIFEAAYIGFFPACLGFASGFFWMMKRGTR